MTQEQLLDKSESIHNIGRINNKILIFFGIVLAVIYSQASLFFPLSQRLDYSDSAIYQYIGYLITKGRAPYVDAFDHKGIYFYFLNTIGYLINKKWGMWIIIITCMFCCIVVIYKTAHKLLNQLSSIIITVMIAGGLGTSFWDGDTPDFFAVLFVLITYDQLLEFFLKNKLNTKQIVIIGLASGIAFWMKPNMILGTAIVCLYVIIRLLANKKFTLVLRCIGYYAISFIAVGVPGIIWLLYKHAFIEMINDYFLFNINYISFNATKDTRLYALGKYLSLPVVVYMLVLLLVLLITSLKTNLLTKTNLALVLCGMLSFAICLVHVASTGNSYEQYAMLFYPSLVYILIGIFYILKDQLFHKKIRVLLSILTAMTLCLIGYKEYTYCRLFWKPVAQEKDVVNFINKSTNDNETIAMISPNYIGYYIATGRDSATKYIYIQANHFVDSKNKSKEEKLFWKKYSNDISAYKPRLIIYDRKYDDYDNVMEWIDLTSKGYKSAGESAQFEFYVLPRDSENEIPLFMASEKASEVDSIHINVPIEITKRYLSGEISEDEYKEIWNKAFEEELIKQK